MDLKRLNFKSIISKIVNSLNRLKSKNPLKIKSKEAQIKNLNKLNILTLPV